MRSSFFVAIGVILVATLAGCGANSPPPHKGVQAQAPAPVPNVAPTPPPTAPEIKPAPVEAPKPRPAKKERLQVEKTRIAQLFQVPEFTRTGANCPDPKAAGPGAPPSIRLLGFSRVDDQPRALIEVKGEVLAVEQGDVIEGVEVVALDEESISFQLAGQRWSNRLFEKRDGDQIKVVNIARATPAGLEAVPPVSSGSKGSNDAKNDRPASNDTSEDANKSTPQN